MNLIRKHVYKVLKNQEYDDVFKEEMVEACLKEYHDALSSGLDKNKAYLIAIKDFDEEFNVTYDASYYEIKYLFNLYNLITFVMSLLLIFVLMLNQVSNTSIFPHSLYFFGIVSNVLALGFYLDGVIRKGHNGFDEFLLILISKLTYLPFILAFVFDYLHFYSYFIFLPVNLIIVLIGHLLLKRRLKGVDSDEEV